MFSKTILLVDDTPLFIKIAKDFFRREQINILTANSGPEAVTIAKNEKPDLIFMDLYMIGGDGDLACKEIKNNINLKLIPIIMVTSSNNAKDSERCLTAGCNEIIHKPLKREEFLEISRKYLKFPAWSGKRSKPLQGLGLIMIRCPMDFCRTSPWAGYSLKQTGSSRSTRNFIWIFNLIKIPNLKNVKVGSHGLIRKEA